jgi:glycosyltransferase involved in cell wall biosynthesis
MKLSVITLTRNEEANIADCLDSVRWADERIVVDSGSTDNTVSIARDHHATVLRIAWEGYGRTKNIALQQTVGEWILWLDADERVTPELAEEIKAVLRSNDVRFSGYCVARRAYFLGRWIRHCGWYPSPVIRLFRRGKGRFSEQLVHEGLLIDGRVGRLNNDLIHLTDPNLEHYFEKFNRYTTLSAEEMHRTERRSSLYDLLVRPLFTFFRMYVLRVGFLDGLEGLTLCVLSSAYVFTKYAKLWQMERNSTLRS